MMTRGTREEREIDAWREGFRRVSQLESVWDEHAARLSGIRACRDWFASQTDFVRLRRLAGLFMPDMSRRALWCALVPCERVAARARVSDAEILVRCEDRPVDVACRMPVTVVADNIRSAFNVGGLFRTSAFLGVEQLLLCGYTATPEHPQVQRAALGGERAVPWRHVECLAEALAALRGRGVAIVALETAEQAVAPEMLDWPFPAALVLGNERFGLGAQPLAGADYVVSVPSYGGKHSLNVVSALAVCGYAARCAWARGGRP